MTMLERGKLAISRAIVGTFSNMVLRGTGVVITWKGSSLSLEFGRLRRVWRASIKGLLA